MNMETTIRRRVRATTQRALAARMGCSPSSVSRLLRGVGQFADLLAAIDLDLQE